MPPPRCLPEVVRQTQLRSGGVIGHVLIRPPPPLSRIVSKFSSKQRGGGGIDRHDKAALFGLMARGG